MLSRCFQLLAALSTATVSLGWAATPLGEKDETDVVRTARTYHIMFASEQRAQEAYSRLKALQGTALFQRFQHLARTESKDGGSAPAGGDLGFVREGEMVRSFETVLFSLAPRTLSQPTRSEFGWHLIYATDFSERKVADLCAAGLKQALRQASPRDLRGLQAASEDPASPGFADRIGQLLGAQWGPALKDGDGNLAFIRTEWSKATPGQASAVMHIEYINAVLHTTGQACRRSVRQEFSIDCKARTAAATVRQEFEGRGASGKRLVETSTAPADRIRFASAQGLGGQLASAACPAP